MPSISQQSNSVHRVFTKLGEYLGSWTPSTSTAMMNKIFVQYKEYWAGGIENIYNGVSGHSLNFSFLSLKQMQFWTETEAHHQGGVQSSIGTRPTEEDEGGRPVHSRHQAADDSATPGICAYVQFAVRLAKSKIRYGGILVSLIAAKLSIPLNNTPVRRERERFCSLCTALYPNRLR